MSHLALTDVLPVISRRLHRARGAIDRGDAIEGFQCSGGILLESNRHKTTMVISIGIHGNNHILMECYSDLMECYSDSMGY